ncbi:restriction endonuclease subunit S [Lichenibacterium dinghuense]|uniref:restriction endonuclease subunit S n=1 Tax=Lichenibacterium dinghuense TaxID=2895977 RepID=UPI001EFF8E7B|nr:restriction endonuclease subunit S [Lichenibacterium sp. 6Y81]
MSDLPLGWTTTRFEAVADIQLGKMLDKAKNSGDPTPYLRNINVRWGEMDTSHVLTMPMSFEERAKFSIRDGDVLVCEGGEPGRAAVWRSGPTDLKFQKAILRVRTEEGISPDWLARYLWLMARDGTLQDHFTGTTIKHLPREALQNISLPLPPSGEQRRIGAKIDSLSARSKRARDQLDHVARLVEKYKKAILKAAFNGDLTENWRFNNPQPTWSIVTIAEAAENLDGRRIPIRASERATRRGTYPYYGASGIIDSIDDFLFDGEYVLIGEDGANLLSRSTPIAFLAKDRFWVNNHAHVLRAHVSCSNAWLAWFLNSIDLSPYVTGSAQPKLTQAALNRIKVPLPQLREQAKVLSRIETALAWIDRLAAEATSARKLIAHLDRAVLAQAFRGELVPQDSADEPASALLKRITGTRDKAPAGRRRSRPPQSALL